MGDRLGLPGAVYTLVGLREPRKSDGSSDWPRVGRKRTSMDVGAVSIRRDPIKSTMCEYLAHKANLLGMKIAWCASMAAQLFISQETELEFEWQQALLSYSQCSALWTAAGWIHALYTISFIHSFIHSCHVPTNSIILHFPISVQSIVCYM